MAREFSCKVLYGTRKADAFASNMAIQFLIMINTLELVLGFFSTEVFEKSLHYKILQDIFNLGTHKNIKYLRLVSNVYSAKDSRCW